MPHRQTHTHLQTKLEYTDGLIKRAEQELAAPGTARQNARNCPGGSADLYRHVYVRTPPTLQRVSPGGGKFLLGASGRVNGPLSNLELLYQEISREECTKEQKKEQKKLKKTEEAKRKEVRGRLRRKRPALSVRGTRRRRRGR